MREEEEEEVAAALDNNDVSREQVDTYACDHLKLPHVGISRHMDFTQK